MKPFNLLAAACLLTLAAACNAPARDGYTLEGKVTDSRLEGRTVYLTDAHDSHVRYDSATVLHGTFRMVGRQDTPQVRELLVQETDSDRFPVTVPVVVENGRIEADLGNRIYVGNTPNNDALMDFLMEKDRFLDDTTNVQAPVEEIRTRFASFIASQVMKHGRSVVGRYLFEAYKGKLTPEQQAQCSRIVHP